jgi:hypothetical protein
MASRSTLVLLFAVMLAVPGAVFAQGDSSAAPPEVDQALRANVSEFFQDFIDGKFRKAINLVAEDTQDLYFASPKAEMSKFSIDGITYSDNFTRALVKLTVTRVLHLKAEGFLQDENIPGPMETDWKIEDGKWVYYEKPKGAGQWVTPMGPSADLAPAAAQAAADRKKKVDDATMMVEAKRILQETGTVTGLTPDEVTLSPDKPSSAQVVFRNGMPGAVSLRVEGLSRDLPGLTAKVLQPNIGPGAQSTVELSFDPSAGKPTMKALTVVVVVSPFDQGFPVKINFASAPQ